MSNCFTLSYIVQGASVSANVMLFSFLTSTLFHCRSQHRLTAICHQQAEEQTVTSNIRWLPKCREVLHKSPDTSAVQSSTGMVRLLRNRIRFPVIRKIGCTISWQRGYKVRLIIVTWKKKIAASLLHAPYSWAYTQEAFPNPKEFAHGTETSNLRIHKTNSSKKTCVRQANIKQWR